jgi:Thiamine pyrophosphate enzyme, C-terminal TPP binding domain
VAGRAVAATLTVGIAIGFLWTVAAAPDTWPPRPACRQKPWIRHIPLAIICWVRAPAGHLRAWLPAALGAGLAHPDRRTVLLIGDGAAQLTIQELGTFTREGLTPVVVVNNDGYAVERAIHGRDADYNNIVASRWQDLPKALGANNVLTYRAQTYGQLEDGQQLGGPVGDHTLCAMVNDLRVCERYARTSHEGRLRVAWGNVLPLLTGGQVVAGSNPVSPTEQNRL